METPPWLITAEQLKAELKEKKLTLVDVRNPEEFEESRIEGCTLIPLYELEERAEELERDSEIVVYCAHGIRSLDGMMLLKERGFKKVRSLEGGIVAWQEAT